MEIRLDEIGIYLLHQFSWAHSQTRIGRAKKGPLHKICHTYPTMIKLSTVIPYLKKVQKIYESHDTPLEFCWHQHIFTRYRQILLYQERQIQIAIWYIISNYFNFFWVFKDCLNKHGYNFDDVSIEVF